MAFAYRKALITRLRYARSSSKSDGWKELPRNEIGTRLCLTEAVTIETPGYVEGDPGVSGKLR